MSESGTRGVGRMGLPARYGYDIILIQMPGFGRAPVLSEQFESEHSPGDPDYADAKEKVLEEHAAAFFEGIVAYTPRPAPKPAATP